MTMISKVGRQRLIIYIFLLLALLSISIIFNVPFLRQILGFVFLTFIPGWLILRIFKLHKLGLTARLVLTVGISIAFTLFAGLLVNTIFPLLGYPTPLTTNSLLISFSIITFFLAIIAYFRNKNIFSDVPALKLDVKEKSYLLVPAIFPLLAILGMRIMNNSNNNIMLMALLGLISSYVVFISVNHNVIPEKIYPPMIFLIGIAVILLLALRSNYLIGVDIHSEYYIFQQTLENGRWQIISNNTLASCLSISVLPVVYQSFLHINSVYLFKLLYPLLFSISPLVIYLIAKKYLNSFYSFLASIFFIAQYYFINAEFSPRTVIAILFFAMAFLVLFANELTARNKYILFIIFAASCIVSHYSTTYIFFIILVLTWILTRILPRISNLLRKPDAAITNKSNVNNINVHLGIWPRSKQFITFIPVAIVFIMLFIWYSMVTGPAFKSGVGFFSQTFNSLQNFFDMGNRGASSAALGVGFFAKTIPQQINFVVSWLTVIFILFGLSAVIYKNSRFHFLDTKYQSVGLPVIDMEYFSVSIVCCLILGISLALPYIFIGYDLNRTYTLMITILSSFFITGGIFISDIIHNKFKYLAIIIVLIPYFLINTGFMYQIFGNPQQIILNSTGTDYDLYYFHDQELFAGNWLDNNRVLTSPIYTDFSGVNRLISGTNISNNSILVISNYLNEQNPLVGYIYLGYNAVVDGNLDLLNNVTELSNEVSVNPYLGKIDNNDKIYSNGGTNIWFEK
jgi:uncharacterized membrane protein